MRAVWFALLILGGCGCGSSDDDPNPANGGSNNAGGSPSNGGGGSAGSSQSGAGGAAAGSSGSGNCDATITEYPPGPGLHLTPCDPITYPSNPPSGGEHYGVWAEFRTYDFPVPAGFLVHSLEHGAVVYWYNCPEGCSDEVAEVQAMIDALPADPACEPYDVDRRVILTPAPELATRWAASAWGWTLTTPCLNVAALEAFYLDHSGDAPEGQLCNPPSMLVTEDTCP